MGINGEAFQLHAVYKKPYWESVSVLKVMRESVSGTESHVHWVCEIEGLYDKIITVVQSYAGKDIISLLPLALLLVLRYFTIKLLICFI